MDFSFANCFLWIGGIAIPQDIDDAETLRAFYNAHVVGFNVASTLVISSLAGAALGLISLQFACVIAGVAWRLGSEMLGKLEYYERDGERFLQGLMHSYGMLPRERFLVRLTPPEVVYGRDCGFYQYEDVEDFKRPFGEPSLHRKAQILTNLKLRNPDWNPVCIRLCGIPVVLHQS